MKGRFSALVLASFVALAAGACDDTSASTVYVSGGHAGGCHQYDSCSSCTPVLGCGWCYLEDGTGRCVSDPDECSQSMVFTWTWNPSGCRVGADAEVAPLADAGPTADAGSTADAHADAPVDGPLASSDAPAESAADALAESSVAPPAEASVDAPTGADTGATSDAPTAGDGGDAGSDAGDGATLPASAIPQ
ncbi:MAG: hypothetical protein JOZ69_00570 [Myxococcales bacterium]|nr:hypothetical protein [Myxococcales bacterium]